MDTETRRATLLFCGITVVSVVAFVACELWDLPTIQECERNMPPEKKKELSDETKGPVVVQPDSRRLPSHLADEYDGPEWAEHVAKLRRIRQDD